jgi:acyl-CoA thioesterase
MDVREFLGLTRSGDDLRWSFDVGTHLITPGQFLFGGCGLGAALVALEEATGRPTVWATAQYVSYAKTHSTVDITVEIQAVGGRLTQARAVAREGDREVLGVTAALGSNTLDIGGVWVEMPDVPAPDLCPPRRLPDEVRNSIFEHVETRVALGRTFEQIDGTPGGPNSAMWARVPGHLEPSAATLAIFGDYVSGGVAHPLGMRVMGRSLDNTIRMVQLEETEWVLCDIRMDALVNGYAQGTAYMWSEKGTLLATASQSLAIKLWDQ